MVKVDPSKLNELVIKIFEGNNVPTKDAKILARVLLEANLSGRASHGVLRVVALRRAERRSTPTSGSSKRPTTAP